VPARQSSAVDRALKRIKKGATAYSAAKAEGIALSTIYRALKRLKQPSRTIRQNIYGNWNGYVSNRKVREFGTDKLNAEWWLNDEAGYSAELERINNAPIVLR
jgi:hypothetical protein